jgi:hypothetical protein
MGTSSAQMGLKIDPSHIYENVLNPRERALSK